MAMSRVTIKGLKKNSAKIKAAVRSAGLEAMKGCMKDLERVASETAPLDEGDLEMSGSHEARKVSNGVVGTVGFEVWNDHPNRSYDFNYAIWIHQEKYNLGKKSKAKAGGTGLSGTHYGVGRLYLLRPFEGEANTYRRIIEETIAEKLEGL